MALIAETPSLFAFFAPRHLGEEVRPPAALPPPLGPIVAALTEAPSVWWGPSVLASTLPGPWIAVEHAPVSQLTRLAELLAQGVHLPDGTVTLARSGTFHGQRGRTWRAAPGNVQLVVHLGVDLPVMEVQAGLTVLPAVALAETIDAMAGDRMVHLKWINDVTWNDAKVAGVLTRTDVVGSRVRSVRFGIGVNVAHAPALPADAAALPAAALALAHPAFAFDGAWAALVTQLVPRLAHHRDELRAGAGDALVDRYRSYAGFLGREVTIWPSDPSHASRPLARGRVSELRSDLTLVVEGHATPIRTGRMRYG